MDPPMPLYHVHREIPNGPTTIAIPVITNDFEIEASNLREAAALVIDKPRGPRPHPANVKQRQDRRPYGGEPIPPEDSRYDGMAFVIVGDRATLPRAISIEALLSAAKACCEAAGLDDDGDREVAIHHLIHGLVDVTSRSGWDFDAVMAEAIGIRASGLQPHASAIASHRLGYPFSEDYSVRGGEAAIAAFAQATGTTGSTPQETTIDMILSLSALALRDELDIVEILSNVAEDKALEAHDREPVAIPTP